MTENETPTVPSDETPTPSEQPIQAEIPIPMTDSAAVAEMPAVSAEPAVPIADTPQEIAAPAIDVAPVAIAEPMTDAAEEQAAPTAEQPEAVPATDTETVAAPPKSTHHDRPRRRRLSDEEFTAIWEELTKAMGDNVILDMKLIKSIRGGALVEYKGLEGFLPMSHFDLVRNSSAKAIEPLIGQPIRATILEMASPEERRFVCSRRTALKRDRFTDMKKGMVLEGVITSIADFGVFVDLGGIDGLVHVSRLSKVRVKHPSEIVKVKQKVKVTVIGTDDEHGRIALSMKEFTESPWVHVGEKYPVGTEVRGKVRNLTPFGVYVQLEGGIDGMIHVSDLSWTRRLNHPNEVVKVGQEVSARVIEVSAEKQRLALSLKDVIPDPWPKLGNIYYIGTEWEGKVKQISHAGALITLPDVDGFIPRGKMGSVRQKGTTKREIPYQVGDVVRVNVVDIDIDRRSLVCGIVREESRNAKRPDHEMEDMKHSASERAFTLGELANLPELFKTSEPPAPVVETPTVEAPAVDVAVEVPAIDLPAAIESTVEQAAATIDPPAEMPALDAVELVVEQPAMMMSMTNEATQETAPIAESLPSVESMVESSPVVESSQIVEAPAIVEAAAVVDPIPAVEPIALNEEVATESISTEPGISETISLAFDAPQADATADTSTESSESAAEEPPVA